jgi:hypothetical protein
VDLAGPTFGFGTILAQPSIRQTQQEILGVQLDGGSAGTSFTVTATATGPTTLTATDSGTFGTTGKNDGIAPPKHVGPIGIDTACDTPVGTHSVTVEAATVDLCNGNNSPAALPLGTFDVTPGIGLLTQTGVLSEFSSGEYGVDECFTTSGINTNPGSVHIDTIVNTNGPCAGFGAISGSA